MRSTLLAVAGLLLLTACADGDADGDGIHHAQELVDGTDPENRDSDGDGLDDGGEVDSGTDPLNPDSDDDGLSDGDEVNQYKTDPNHSDSDGDGYLDGWEVEAGSNPADAGSVIYKGGWPYNPNHGNFTDLSGVSGYGVGDTFPAEVLQDQFGEMVNIADFAENGQYILIDFSAEWCAPCHDMSDWVANGNLYYELEWPGVTPKIQDGTLRWITILGQDDDGNDPDLEDLQRWDEDYPHDEVPVLGGNATLNDAYIVAWPSIYLLDENMTIIQTPGNPSFSDYYRALEDAADI